MWTKAKRQLLDALRRQAATHTLPTAHQQTLEVLLDEPEQDECPALRPVLESLCQEQNQFQLGLGRVQAQYILLSPQYQALLARSE